MRQRAPVSSWSTDFDHLDPHWTQDPYPIWDELRTSCPIARTQRFGGVHLPTREADVRAIAYDTDHFSSRTVVVREHDLKVETPAPPMTADPPHHRQARMILMTAFRPDVIGRFETDVQGLCASAAAAVQQSRGCDAAFAYARPVALRAIVRFLGLPDADASRFRAWIGDVLDEGVLDGQVAVRALADMSAYVERQIARRRYAPGPGALGHLLSYRVDGRPLSDAYVVATVRLLLLAGVETTASALGAALWHLARHEEDRRRLVGRPELIPAAIEELLRLYAPVTMAREVAQAVDLGGTRFEPGQKVLLCYPAANRDPAAFPDPDRFMMDRRPNRHLSFGIGIHRCIGAGLARTILRVGLEAWLSRFPEFRMDPSGAVEWSRGAVRGPLRLDVLFQ